MIHILDEQPSIIDQYLYELRHKDIQKDRARFRFNIKRTGILMATEIAKRLPYTDVDIETPLGTKTARKLSEYPVLISILRAGQPLLEGFQEVFVDSECGFIGAFRVEEGDEKPSVAMRYQALPDLTSKTIIIVDPMLATGNSIVSTLKELAGLGASHVHIACVVAAPEGIQHIEEEISIPYTLWIASMDDKLNKQAYIVPGLGDAGDLSYGIKL